MRALRLLFCAGTLFIASAAEAQKETSTFTVIENLSLPARAVSSDGHYICGDYRGQAFVHDTETNTTVIIPPTYNEFDVSVLDGLGDVSKTGIAVGHWGDNPAYYENDEWHRLPMPSNREMGTAFGVTDDGNIIVGESEVSFKYGPGMPLIWTREADGYKLDSLPHPDRDEFGREIARCGAMYISKDGSVIAGRFQDKSFGQFAELIVWKKVNGEWEYTLLGSDLIYDKTKPHPGNMPLPEDYLTAQPDTPEYQAQVEEYNAAIEEFFIKLQGEDSKGAYSRMRIIDTVVGGFNMSSNGRYLLGTIKDGVTENSHAFSIDLQDLAVTEYADITSGGASACVSNDGTLFFASAYRSPIQDGTVLLPGAGEPISLVEYYKSRSGEDYSSEIADLGGIAGMPIISADNNTVVCWLGTPDFVPGDLNYYVRFAPVDAIHNLDKENIPLVSLENHVLHINGMAETVAVYDLAGKVVCKGSGNLLDVNNLAHGVYLVNAIVQGKTVSEKIIVR